MCHIEVHLFAKIARSPDNGGHCPTAIRGHRNRINPLASQTSSHSRYSCVSNHALRTLSTGCISPRPSGERNKPEIAIDSTLGMRVTCVKAKTDHRSISGVKPHSYRPRFTEAIGAMAPPASRSSILRLINASQHGLCPCHGAGVPYNHPTSALNQLRKFATPVQHPGNKEYAFEVRWK